jgi:hypothetical protein
MHVHTNALRLYKCTRYEATVTYTSSIARGSACASNTRTCIACTYATTHDTLALHDAPSLLAMVTTCRGGTKRALYTPLWNTDRTTSGCHDDCVV